MLCETMMEAKLPGCGIKATPHITSRLKTLKRLWQTAYDIIYGPNTSGFGWDPETKLVTADDDVWEKYLKLSDSASCCCYVHDPVCCYAPFAKANLVHLFSFSALAYAAVMSWFKFIVSHSSLQV
ncbi:hypothetical protein K1719_040849 [Acacia pycnantha]|nr:hypothetical protein K1719_040849 [Acacia pycnantha]